MTIVSGFLLFDLIFSIGFTISPLLMILELGAKFVGKRIILQKETLSCDETILLANWLVLVCYLVHVVFVVWC